GHRLDPDHMILDLLDAGDVFGGYPQGDALAIIEHDAGQFYDPAVYFDVRHSQRRPRLLLHLVDQFQPDRVVIRRRRWRLVHEARERAQQVRSRDDAGDLVPAQHGYALDAPAFHQRDDLFERGFLGDG